VLTFLFKIVILYMSCCGVRFIAVTDCDVAVRALKIEKLNLLMKIEIFQACSQHITYSNSYVKNVNIISHFYLANDYVFSLTIEQKFCYI